MALVECPYPYILVVKSTILLTLSLTREIRQKCSLNGEPTYIHIHIHICQDVYAILRTYLCNQMLRPYTASTVRSGQLDQGSMVGPIQLLVRVESSTSPLPQFLGLRLIQRFLHHLARHTVLEGIWAIQQKICIYLYTWL